MEWILVASFVFVNGVEGTAEFIFPTEESCKRVVENLEGARDNKFLFGVEEFNVTCEPMATTKEDNNVELY